MYKYEQYEFWSTFGCLQTLNPEYISMTWGALGTNSQASVEILEGLMADSKVPVAAHLTCVGHTESSMRQVIADLQAMGVNRFVALRGDRPKELSDAQSDTQLGALSDTQLNTQSKAQAQAHTDPSHLQHASDLVAILAEDPSRDISVAAYPEAHPESDGLEQDIHWLKHKLDKGAQRAITQFFFSADTFLRFRDKAQAAGITQTLVPGILPIHDIAKVKDFSAKCGAHVPQELVERFSKAGESGSQSAQACRSINRYCPIRWVLSSLVAVVRVVVVGAIAPRARRTLLRSL